MKKFDKTVYRGGGGGGAVYCLGVIGAIVYYIQAAESFWAGFVGVIQAFFWPAFVVYDLLRFLHQ